MRSLLPLYSLQLGDARETLRRQLHSQRLVAVTMALSGSTNIIIVSAVFTALAVVFALLRFRARDKQHAPLLADDYLIAVAALTIIGVLCRVYGECCSRSVPPPEKIPKDGSLTIATEIAAVQGHLGDHIPLDSNSVPQYDPESLLSLNKGSTRYGMRILALFYELSVANEYWLGQTVYASELLGYFPLTLTKISILLFYRRIFRGQKFSAITIALMVLSGAWGVSFFFATLFNCFPISYAWTSPNGTPEFEAHCYDPNPMFYGSAVSNMIVDIFILLIPAPNVWKLNIPRKRKIAVLGIFLLGAFVVGITAIRVSVFVNTGSKIGTDYDITYNLGGVIYWSQLEIAIAIICGCLPTLHVILVDSTIRRLFKSATSKVSLLISGQRSDTSEEPGLSGPSRLLRDEKSASSIPRDLETCEEVRLESFELSELRPDTTTRSRV
ncbi:hypothetical protein O1611_g2929 [Lasiodiplodia mahajangana]|uniref:Uncharacterized protein n=1 Tax=Lasiodiplodia mahajangana TaxID=1108764 RepID=A0ACC2JTH1_9PEZI|nr:hypothetical protein O1611_g2929 [Lasiodiplodia mahajangana]